MARPGIMLYFDIRQPLKVLPDAEKGRLFDAILEYGEYGTIPEFDGMLAMAWGFIQPKLDRDEESYENSIAQRKYAAFCKKRANLNLPKISFEEWKDMTDYERERPTTAVNERYPTTTATASATVTPTTTVTPSTTTTATASTTTTATASAAAAATADEFATATATDKKLELLQGELGKGVVALTDDQIEILLGKMGIEMFDHYVDKLSTFIIEKDAKVKNHYSTILKWWLEDSDTGGGQ